MSKPAARIGDTHFCPMVTPGGVPHEGGDIISGCQTVWIENKRAATVGEVCLCNGGILDAITTGSSGVFIEGKPAARQGDLCAHGGIIRSGSVTVLIGETKNPDLTRALNEEKNKVSFIEPSEEEKIVIINQAIQESINLLERKLGLLEQGDSRTLDAFMRWFGNVDNEAKQTILTRIERMLEVCRTLTVDNFGRIEDEKDKKEVYMQVYNKDNWYTFFLGNTFWQLGTTGVRSMAGVLIHELSHFKNIGNTLDNAYKEKRCLQLAQCDPKGALYNADSFEYFIAYVE